MHQALNQRSSTLKCCLLASVCLLFPILIIGCAQETVTEVKVAEKKPATPEEKFEKFLTELKKLVESRNSYSSVVPGLAADSGSPTTTLNWSAKVSHQLVPPKEGKPHRAMVTIYRNTEVTVVIPSNDSEEIEKERVQEEQEFKLAKEYMPELVDANGVAGNPVSKAAAPSIETLPDKDVTSYELEYQNGKWVLLTPIDGIEYPFTSSAFDMALRLQ